MKESLETERSNSHYIKSSTLVFLQCSARGTLKGPCHVRLSRVPVAEENAFDFREGSREAQYLIAEL